VSNNEMSIFSKGIDEQTNEIASTSPEPYQFKPVDANASNTDEDESSDEEPVGKLPS